MERNCLREGMDTMFSEYKETAFAKVNLILKCTGFMPNGYHRLWTVMRELSLSDRLTLAFDEKRGIRVSVPGRDDIDNKDNICYKAASLFIEKMQIPVPGINIEIEKHIPSEAGLGGGSSDAAAVLRILSRHYKNPFSREELNDIAVRTGADVPFFIDGGCCLCEGVGDVLTPFKRSPSVPALVLRAPEGVSTPACYKAFDGLGESRFDEEAYKMLTAELDQGRSLLEVIRGNRELFVNDLEAPAESFVPQIRDLVALLYDCGASFAMMSGSGSAVFGLFETEEEAKSAYEKALSDERALNALSFVTKLL